MDGKMPPIKRYTIVFIPCLQSASCTEKAGYIIIGNDKKIRDKKQEENKNKKVVTFALSFKKEHCQWYWTGTGEHCIIVGGCIYVFAMRAEETLNR